MAVMRTSSAPEVFLPLRRDDPEPLHRQLEQQLRDAVRSGRLTEGSTVPSTRSLAQELGVARGVVVEAYEQLVAEGYLLARPGGATRVARVPGPSRRAVPAPSPAAFDVDLRPGRPDLREFPRTAWMRSVRRVLNEAPATSLGYLDGRGVPELREALADYLNRARGTCINSEQIVISSGFAQGLQLVATTLRAAGARAMAVEDPWHAEYRTMIEDAGLSVRDVAVDQDGLRLDLLDTTDASAAVVTPAHQFPTGVVLSPERRASLIDWADRRDGVLVEDDYDAEFRYDREPIGALQGLCAERVVYAGTASKILAPGLRLGWLAAPPRLVPALAAAKLAADAGSGSIDQLALADFIARGELDRHLRRVRVLYRSRRDALLDALARHLPAVEPIGISAGLQFLAWLPDGVDEATLVAKAAEHGIALSGFTPLSQRPTARGGLVIGFAASDEHRIEEGVRRLAGLLAGEGGR